MSRFHVGFEIELPLVQFFFVKFILFLIISIFNYIFNKDLLNLLKKLDAHMILSKLKILLIV